MAEAEAAVATVSVACEEEEVSVSVMAAEPEAEEGTRVVAVEASVIKRKMHDLDSLENDKAPAKKQQHVCVSESTLESLVLIDDQGTAASDETAPVIGAKETDFSGNLSSEEPVTVSDGTASDSAQDCTVVEGNVEEPSGYDVEIGGAGPALVKIEKEELLGSELLTSTDNIQHAFVNDAQDPSLAPHQDGLRQAIHQTPYDLSSTSHKIEIPNNKLGIVVGKSGETIRHLQINSGARIHITRDAGVGSLSSTRSVELTRTLENISKAEQLIKNVIEEADTGGSPSLVSWGFCTSQPGSEQIELQIPNGKVGLIIGKGGETIRNLQTKTGAHIQLIPPHLSEGDSSMERIVRISGNKNQVEFAKEMIKDVMNQPPMGPSSQSNTFHPPRGRAMVTQWAPRPMAPTQQAIGYGYQQIGLHPPQTTQNPPPYIGYSQHPPTRGTYGSSWDQQRSTFSAPMQTASPQSDSYGYYNQGSLVPNNQPSNPLPVSVPASSPPINYNYAQPQSSAVYGNWALNAQPPPAQKYELGYNGPIYENQPVGQQLYEQQQPIGSPPVLYGQQSSTPYGRPANGEVPPYVPARPSQPTQTMYQGAATLQPYPFASTAPTQHAPYSQAYASVNGYSQQLSGVYLQKPTPGYGQGRQALPVAYGQSVHQSGGYIQNSSSQPSYEQTAQTNVNYGYQLGYAHPTPNPPPQECPQPGYGGQYDSAQIYGQH